MRRLKVLQIGNWFVPPLVTKTTNSIPAKRETQEQNERKTN
jgi:hypothetical protein